MPIATHELRLKTHEPWPIMVLAHNEERFIEACLDSLFVGEPDLPMEVYVMANGCTDRTEDLVRAYSKRRPTVHLVSLALGDKCNAWNVFVHDTVVSRCPGRSIYFFMDGDARIVPGSLSAMARVLESDSHAHAVSAPPASGRNVARDRRELLEQRLLVANLYGLRGSFVDRLIETHVRLPLKLEGDDGLLGALIKWDLEPKLNKFDHRRIAPCAEAGFEFESFSPFSIRDIIAYWRRAVRYGRRLYEFELLRNRFKQIGIDGMPVDITELYPGAGDLRLRRSGIYTISNWFALRKMRKIGRSLACN